MTTRTEASVGDFDDFGDFGDTASSWGDYDGPPEQFDFDDYAPAAAVPLVIATPSHPHPASGFEAGDGDALDSAAAAAPVDSGVDSGVVQEAAKAAKAVSRGAAARIKEVRFRDVEGQPLARAVGLALGIMKHLRCASWAEIDQRCTESIEREANDLEWFRKALAGIVLSEEQEALLDRYEAFLPFLRLTPTVTIAICPSCFHVVDAPVTEPVTAEHATAEAPEQQGVAPAPVAPDGDDETLPRAISPAQAHGWSVVAGTVPTKCRLTPGCTAKPVKVAATAKVS